MSRRIGWGILGTGAIAHKFALGLAALDYADLVAVGSRSAGGAREFAEEFSVPHRHADYESLAEDEDVDVVYVATPNPFHREHCLLCLRGCKAVLCEKPFALNAAQAEEVIGEARQRELFLMEAMWTRFLPVMGVVRGWIADGAVGEVRMVTADFGFRAEFAPEGRLFDLHLGGGSLLDVGVYTLSLASMVLGPNPTSVESAAHLGESGVDEQAAFILKYAGGQLAVLSSAIRTQTPHQARIIGTEGIVEIDPDFHSTKSATLRAGGRTEGVELPLEGNGFNYEAAEVGRCLREDALESQIMPLDETLGIVRIMDRIRGAWGLTYPSE
jgi:predicted dehydrogenase